MQALPMNKMKVCSEAGFCAKGWTWSSRVDMWNLRFHLKNGQHMPHTHIPVSMKEASDGPLFPFHLIMPFCLLNGDGKAVSYEGLGRPAAMYGELNVWACGLNPLFELGVRENLPFLNRPLQPKASQLAGSVTDTLLVSLSEPPFLLFKNSVLLRGLL